jgi:hypothetical protein
MIKKVLLKMPEISASCLSKCSSKVYGLSKSASLKVSDKCFDCSHKTDSACTRQSLKFSGTADLSKAFFDIEASSEGGLEDNMKNVQLKDNPDSLREDMTQKYEINDDSGMNITLDKMRDKSSGELDIQVGLSDVDSYL